MLPEYQILEITSEANQYELLAAFEFAADCEYFDGHFEDFVLLPAVAQLFIVNQVAFNNFGDLGKFKQMSQVKFRLPICPNMPVLLELLFDATAQSLKFKYINAASDELHSSGTIWFQ